MSTDAVLIGSAVVGLSLILAATVHALGRMRVAEIEALRQLIGQGIAVRDALAALGIDRHRRRLRQGLLLIGVGLAWGVTTFLIGGKAYLAGLAPLLLGATLLLMHAIDARAE